MGVDHMADLTFEREDVRANKTVAALGYVLFFLPLIVCGNSKLGRYCANQGLLLLLSALVLRIVLGIFKWVLLFGLLYDLAVGVVNVGATLIGIYMAWQLLRHDRVTRLPIIGEKVIIK